METLLSSLITGAIVMGLVGVIWKGLTGQIEKIESSKVNKETCNIVHKEVDSKFTALFAKLDEQSTTLGEIAGDVKVIMREVNNDG